MVKLSMTISTQLAWRPTHPCLRVSTMELFAFSERFIGTVATYESLEGGERVYGPWDMLQKLPTGLQPRVRVDLAPGDSIVAVHKYHDQRGIVGVAIKTKLKGLSAVCGEVTQDMTTECVVDDAVEACGLAIRIQRGTVQAVSLRLRPVVSLYQLLVSYATLRQLNATSSVKDDALIDALQGVISRVEELLRRQVISIGPVIATLDHLCLVAQTQHQPRLRVIWKTRAGRKLALERIREAVETLNAAMLLYEATESEFLTSSTTDDVPEANLRVFIDQEISVANAAHFVKLHGKYPHVFVGAGVTDRLLIFLIQAGDVNGLDQVVSGLARVEATTVPQTMAAFAQRVPAIRLAVASSQLPSLCWLIGIAQLEPLNPPAAPSPHLIGLPVSPLEMVACAEPSPAKETISFLLKQVERRCRFMDSWFTFAKRLETPVTLHEMLNLVINITGVQELRQLDVLASTSLTPVEQSYLFNAAAEHVILHSLVLHDDALDLFLLQLAHAREIGLITCRAYTQIKWRAKKINIGSAPCIVSLQETVRALQLRVADLESHMTSLQHQLTTIHQWAVDLQRDALDNAQRQRIVAIVTTVLSSFGGPLLHALANCLDISDPTEVLSLIIQPDALDIGRSLAEDAMVITFRAGIEEAVRSLGGDPVAIVELLRAATPTTPHDSDKVVVARLRVRGRPLRHFQAVVRSVIFTFRLS